MSVKRLTDLVEFTDTAINDLDFFWTDEVQESTVTISIATPCVVGWTAHGLVANNQVVFSTDGALPTEIVAGTAYYVIATGLTVDSFQISLTSGGVAINTTGAQSGVHSASSYISKKISGLKLKSILGNVAYSTTFTPGTVDVANVITHNLNTEDIVVQLWDVTNSEVIYADITFTSTTQINIKFDSNPSGQVKVIVLGKGGLTADSRPYKVLTGIVSQVTTGVPTIIILENTLGVTPVWSRVMAGNYQFTSVGTFTAGKTVAFLQMATGSFNSHCQVSSTINVIELVATNNALSLADDLLVSVPFEIRVYN